MSGKMTRAKDQPKTPDAKYPPKTPGDYPDNDFNQNKVSQEKNRFDLLLTRNATANLKSPFILG
jgi:hypothetical protein